MASQAQDLRNLICGTLKIVEATEQRDSSRRVVWKAECLCGKFEFGSRPQLEKYAGYCECPGHPFKGKEKPVEGFRLHPEERETLKNVAAMVEWECRRHPEPPKEESNKILSASENKVLRERLGLSGYQTETITLRQPVKILGCKAEKVVFAKKLDGDDRVLLHVQLVSVSGKRSIVSSRKKMPETEWDMVSDVLAGMKIKWRDREMKRVPK